MIITSSGFKRLMKESFKANRLHVHRPDPYGLYVGGDWWFLYAKSLSDLENKDKAAIIEFCGDLPGSMEGYLAGKDKGNQMEQTEPLSEFDLAKAEKADEVFVRMGIRIGEDGHEVFYSRESGKPCMILSECWDILTSDMPAAAVRGGEPDFLFFEDDHYIFAVHTSPAHEGGLDQIILGHMSYLAADIEAWKENGNGQ